MGVLRCSRGKWGISFQTAGVLDGLLQDSNGRPYWNSAAAADTSYGAERWLWWSEEDRCMAEDPVPRGPQLWERALGAPLRLEGGVNGIAANGGDECRDRIC